MKLLSFSGAATKIAAHAAHGKIILQSGYKPDIVTGVSSGALIILPLILGKHDLLEEFTTHLKLSDIFSQKPVNEKGKITFPAIIRGIFKGSLGNIGNLKNTMEKFVTKKEYDEFKSNHNSPLVYIGVTSISEDKFKLVCLNNINYYSFINVIMASCSIPIYCPPIKINNYYYYDGGLKHHNPGIEILRKYQNTIKEVISVYSRPFLINETPDTGYNGKSLGRNLSKSVDALQNSISLEDQNSEREFCLNNKIKIEQRFTPSIMKGIYDVDNERLKTLYNSIK